MEKQSVKDPTDVSGKSNELMKRRWSGLSGVALFLHIQTEKKEKMCTNFEN